MMSNEEKSHLDREAMQEVAVRQILSGYYRTLLTPSVIEKITKELMREMTQGESAWAFKETINA